MTITVNVPGRPYEVHIGRGILPSLGEVVTGQTRAKRVLVVTQEPVARHYLDTVASSLRDHGIDVHVATVPDGEAAKSPAVLQDLWSTCAAVPLERRDAIIALGGGVVGDLAGFVAATWNRGIHLVQVPTTLLAQTDAAIGGKTGIDLAAGKNLVGAFHQPVAVIADIDTLATLDERTRVEGFGEVVKYGLIRDLDILDLLEAGMSDARAGDPELLEVLVRRSVAVKSAVVADDVHESGQRAHLNFGHTYAHALETLTGYDRFLHGEAVAIGMLVALRIGEAMGLHGPVLRERTTPLLEGLGLPVSAPALDRQGLWEVMARDKKADDGVRFVLLEGLGQPTLRQPDRATVETAIAAVETA
jgi:3-dehydroquinate synthase